MEDNKKRHYESSALPTFHTPAGNDSEAEISRQIYAEVHSNYRNLADIRFKLLGFVPAVSIIAWAELIDKFAQNNLHNAAFGLVIAIFGIRITYGIRIYDKRNNELYNDLISRGRKIEEEWGIHTGIFKGRLEPNTIDKLFKKEINHSRGLDLIYTSVFTGWTIVSIWFIYKLIMIIPDVF